MTSRAARFAVLTDDQRQIVRSAMTPEQITALAHDWRFWGRPEQFAPGSDGASDPRTDWLTWLVLSGRGWGKSRSGAEWTRERVAGGARRLVIAGPTAADVRDVMLEGESGLLNIYPPGEAPLYEPSKRRVTWKNGATAVLLSAEEPDRFRGVQGDTSWCDELCAWQYPEAFEMLRFAMRLGQPRFMVTTTPRPTPLIKELIKDPRTVITRGSTFDNSANLAADFIAAIRDKYEGTRLGRQELFAEILDDVPGALWNTTQLDALRVKTLPALRRVVIAIDPAVSANAGSDETGIVAAGVGECRCKGSPELHGFVLADASGKYTPDGWARASIALYDRLQGDRIVAERNQGGDLVESNLRTVSPHIPYRSVHASKGKRLRAEPVSALYEQGKIHHVLGLHKLETEMTMWDPMDPRAPSPNRIDALVYALTDLMLGGGAPTFTYAPGALTLQGAEAEE